jgi:hypothetical protein
MDFFCTEHPGHDYILDDDIPDAYADWISGMDQLDLIELADKYGRYLYQKGKEAFIKGL